MKIYDILNNSPRSKRYRARNNIKMTIMKDYIDYYDMVNYSVLIIMYEIEEV